MERTVRKLAGAGFGEKERGLRRTKNMSKNVKLRDTRVSLIMTLFQPVGEFLLGPAFSLSLSRKVVCTLGTKRGNNKEKG